MQHCATSHLGPDQMQHCAASHLGLRCLPISSHKKGINGFHSYKFSDVTTEDITLFSQLVSQKSKVKRELIKAQIT